MMFNTLGGSFLGGNGYGVFGLAFLIGLIFFTVWAVKKLKPEDLFKTAIVLLILGVIGWFLIGTAGGMTGGRSGANWSWGSGMMGGGFGQGMMMGGMMQCVQDDECFNVMKQMMKEMEEHENNNDR